MGKNLKGIGRLTYNTFQEMSAHDLYIADELLYLTIIQFCSFFLIFMNENETINSGHPKNKSGTIKLRRREYCFISFHFPPSSLELEFCSMKVGMEFILVFVLFIFDSMNYY